MSHHTEPYPGAATYRRYRRQRQPSIWLRESGGLRTLDWSMWTEQRNRSATMQFRIRDLAAERCVWSVPPVGTVPMKLRCQTLGVRAFDVHGKMVGQTLSESGKLADAIARLFADGPREVSSAPLCGGWHSCRPCRSLHVLCEHRMIFCKIQRIASSGLSLSR